MISIRLTLLSVKYKNFLLKIVPILATILLVFSFAPLPSVHGSSDVIGTITIHIGNLRSKPTLYSSIIYKLNKGDRVTFLKRKDKWYVVKLSNGLAGWVHQSLFLNNGSEPEINTAFLKQEESKTETKATLRVSVGRVRKRPSRNADIMYTLKKRETPSVLFTQDDWNLIETKDGRLGWAHQSLFIESPRKQVPETQVIQKAKARIPEIAVTKPIEKQIETHIIKEIEYVMTPEGEEMVTFLLSEKYPPKTFSIAGDRPKVICDFFNAQLGAGIERYLKVDGELIKQIRIGVHKGSRSKIRVVLDLVPDNEYKIKPVFFEKDDLYALIVKKAK